MASDKPFNYHVGLWLFSIHYILSQTYLKFRNDRIEDSEMDNRLEENRFCLPYEEGLNGVNRKP